MPEKKVSLEPGEDFIRLGQLIKFVGLVERGSDAKEYLADHPIQVNGHAENRRGAKLRPGDSVVFDNLTVKICGSGD